MELSNLEANFPPLPKILRHQKLEFPSIQNFDLNSDDLGQFRIEQNLCDHYSIIHEP